MLQVNMHEAKTKLSSLVAQGETFIIAKAGKPVVTVTPYISAEKKSQRVGFLKGLVKLPDDFNRLGEVEISSIFGVEK
ncbi:MAG: hypothetical protein FWC20_03130 [Oscillospiraceae bacterium]|nr:hypothetical protein [Oscillospiraceae bacterium]MCL2278385.1 hypothetical protein [Oscillospiraceae bacterium]